MAATMGSEATAAAVNQAAIRRDPMAMLPFCGYNMADYWSHWLKLGNSLKHPPKIFRVNWFRKDEDGGFAWPGFGENMRVLNWIVDRVNGSGEAVESPFGYMPKYQDINWQGLDDFASDTFEQIMDVDREAGKKEVEDLKGYFETFEDRLPAEMEIQRQAFSERLDNAPEVWRING
jgi:phosphoenolpyruvate carboxykinase (GTP)